MGMGRVLSVGGCRRACCRSLPGWSMVAVRSVQRAAAELKEHRAPILHVAHKLCLSLVGLAQPGHVWGVAFWCCLTRLQP